MINWEAKAVYLLTYMEALRDAYSESEEHNRQLAEMYEDDYFIGKVEAYAHVVQALQRTLDTLALPSDTAEVVSDRVA